jgi:ketosteroid isomerase-like protein
MTLEANKKLALDFLGAVAAGNVAAVSAMMADDATWWVMPSTPLSGTHKKDVFLTMFPHVLELGDGPLTYRFDEVTAEGDRVSLTAKGHLKMKSGKVYNGDYHFLLFIEDGKIARGKEYVDTAHIAEIFGASAEAEPA